jgi:hypothetical protein
MLKMVSEHGIKAKINPYMRLKELPNAVEFCPFGQDEG